MVAVDSWKTVKKSGEWFQQLFFGVFGRREIADALMESRLLLATSRLDVWNAYSVDAFFPLQTVWITFWILLVPCFSLVEYSGIFFWLIYK